MYYYGYDNGYASYNQPYNNGFVGYTQSGLGNGAALWIVLFILLVIIIGANFSFGNKTLTNKH